MKRVFLGIIVGGDLNNRIEKFKKDHLTAGFSLKLVESLNSHIAIKFFGNLTDQQISVIDKNITDNLTAHGSVPVKIPKLTYFPDLVNARVIALRVISREIELLAKQICFNLEKLPFVIKENRLYTPHITLARVKSTLTTDQKSIIANLDFNGTFKFNTIQLFESKLTPSGPVYSVIKSYNL